jgi:hypothetical protein
MLLVPGSPEDLADNVVIEQYSAEELDSAVECMMHTIRKEVRYAPQDTTHKKIHMANPG